MEYHIPVMLDECLEGLAINPSGTYVDVTFGSGAHSRAILEHLDADGRLLSFDQDIEAAANITEDSRFTFVKSNFRYLRKMLKLEDVYHIDGVLADLGVSSHQLDFPERGFSYRFDAPLDMRMNEASDVKAIDVLATYDEKELQRIFSQYGEVRNARSLARGLAKERERRQIATTYQFNEVLDSFAMGLRNKYFAQVYQAIRIEVNEEMVALKEMLDNVMQVLKPGGRLVVMSYHSLEDRMVKNYLKSGNADGKLVKDEYGHIERPFKLITKKPVMASEEEVKRNSRARSAKLRIGEKLNTDN